MESFLFRIKKQITRLPLYFFLLALVSAGCGGYLLTIPADQKNSVLFGLSLERAALFTAFIACALGAAAIGLVLFRSAETAARWKARLQKHEQTIHAAFLIFGWITAGLLLSPNYRFGEFSDYFQRLKPAIFLIFWAAASGTLLLSSIDFRAGWNLTISAAKKLFTKPFFIFLLIFIVSASFIRLSGWGITAGNEAWYENAIPLQIQQVALGLTFLCICSSIAGKRSWKKLFQSRTINFFVIWALAAVIWSFAPMKSHFFAPGPYPPNAEFYPYSDANHNDAAAQSALYGLGFNHGRIVLKPVVSFVIYLCGLLTGNRMNAMLMLQSALFAILPAAIYLIASDLAGNFCGWFAASLVIFQEWNALNTTQILTIHSRLEMSEFLSQVLFAFFALFMLRWLLASQLQSRYAAAAGGVLGLLVYTRFNFMALLPAVMLYVVVALWKMKRKALVSLLVFVFSFSLCIAPWLVRSYQITGTFSPEIWGSFKAVVIGQRLKPVIEAQPESSIISPEIQSDSGLKTVASLIQAQTMPSNAAADQPQPAELKLRIHPLIDTIGNHFLHNLSALLFILPTQLQFDDLDHLYTAENSVWQQRWDGKLTLPQGLMATLNLIILSIGLALIWRRFGWAGLSVLYFAVVYAASLGLARTSGGRYLVPMNWVIIVLFSCGICAIIQKDSLLTATDHPAASSAPLTLRSKLLESGRLLLISFSFCMIYLSMILIEQHSTPAFQDKPVEEASSAFKQAFPDLNWDLIDAQLAAGSMQLQQGIALYPRFYYFNQGEHGSDQAYATQPYSRMVFKIMTADGNADAVLPIQSLPESFPNHASISMLGCLSEGSHYIHALAVIGESENQESFQIIREPLQSFSCPVPEPICAETNNCY